MSSRSLFTIGMTIMSILTIGAPVVSSAATLRNHVLTPDGFCTVNADGTRGVRDDGQTYEAWLAEHAFGNEAAYRTNLRASGLYSDPEIERMVAEMKAKEARFQLLNIQRGQNQLCR